MKAVILAGGAGSRLRPLTCDLPKPMAPIVNKPIMQHIVELLARQGFTEILVTLWYLPEVIREYFGDGSRFGVRLHYVVEEQPLGTAGSVKNGEGLLDETFVIVSGDALTDVDLQAALRFHQSRSAAATLLLKSVPNPLEYGVVICGPDGAIRRFLEKPSAGQVFSDTVNTGIYVLEPDTLRRIPAGTPFDFSKDLFPQLLAEGERLYAHVTDAYWSDVGTLEQYRQAHYDVLEGRCRVEIPGRQVEEGVWLGEGVQVAPGARVVGPVVIGDSCQVDAGAEVGPGSVLGRGTHIAARASVRRSVLWHGVHVGPGAELRGVLAAGGCQVGKSARLFEGAALGERAVLEPGATLRPGVKLWPAKRVEAGSVVLDSVVWAGGWSRNLVGETGARGTPNVELTPELALRIGAAFGDGMQVGERVLVGHGGAPAAELAALAAACGLASTGIEVLMAGEVPLAALRHGCRELEVAGGLYVDLASEVLQLRLFDRRGLEVPQSVARSVDGTLRREDWRRAAASRVGRIRPSPDFTEAYLRTLADRFNRQLLRSRRLRVVVGGGSSIAGLLIRLLDRLGCSPVLAAGRPVGDAVRSSGAAAGIEVDPSDPSGDPDAVRVWDERGNLVRPEVIEVLAVDAHAGAAAPGAAAAHANSAAPAGAATPARVAPAAKASTPVNAATPEASVALPITAVDAVDGAVAARGLRPVRTRLHPQALAGSAADGLHPWIDPLVRVGRLLERLALSNAPLSRLAGEAAAGVRVREVVPCPWRAKGQVIRRLVEQARGQTVELVDGVKVRQERGWALVLPDPDEPALQVYAEAATLEDARDLAREYAGRIHWMGGFAGGTVEEPRSAAGATGATGP